MNRVTGWIAVLVLGTTAASPTQAAVNDLFWQGSNVTNVLTDANYSADGPVTNQSPTTTSVLHVGANGVVSYSTPGPVQFGKLRVGHNSNPTGGSGLNGPGTLTISNGAQVSLTAGAANIGNAALFVGNIQKGTLIIDGPGTSVTSNRLAAIGYGNNLNAGREGNVFVQNGAALSLTLGHIQLGVGTSSAFNGVRGNLTMTGAGSSISISSASTNLVIGQNATSTYTQTDGTLDVEDHIYVGRDKADGSFMKVSGGIVTGGAMTVGAAEDVTTPVQYADNCVAEFTGTADVTLDTNNLNIGLGDAQNSSLLIADQAAVKVTSTTGTNGNVFLGRGTSNNTKFTMTGGTLFTGKNFLMGSATGATNILGNQSGGTITTTLNFVAADGNGASTYNLSGNGAVNSNGLVIIGRQVATAVMNQTGGSVTAALGVHVGNAQTTTTTSYGNGTYNVSGGTITANQTTGPALQIGIAGTGTFRVIGDDAIINVNGDMTVNPIIADTSQGTLAFQLEAGESLSQITVTGAAAFNAGSILSLDVTNEPTPASFYDVLTAASIDAGGLTFSGPVGWNYSVIDGGLGKILRLAQDVGPGLPGDHNDDGVVDILDYVVWRMDPDNNGGSPGGFDDWAENYGNPPGSGSSQAQGSAVPEPATCGMILVMGLVSLMSRSIRRP